MKKLSSIISLVLAIAMLAGCGASITEPSASPTVSSNPSLEPSDILTMCPVLSKHLEAAA